MYLCNDITEKGTKAQTLTLHAREGSNISYVEVSKTFDYTHFEVGM